MSDLLPCPLCAHPATLFDLPGGCEVCCGDCDLQLNVVRERSEAVEAMRLRATAAWNSRAPAGREVVVRPAADGEECWNCPAYGAWCELPAPADPRELPDVGLPATCPLRPENGGPVTLRLEEVR